MAKLQEFYGFRLTDIQSRRLRAMGKKRRRKFTSVWRVHFNKALDQWEKEYGR
jgi:hypothetical protein